MYVNFMGFPIFIKLLLPLKHLVVIDKLVRELIFRLIHYTQTTANILTLSLSLHLLLNKSNVNQGLTFSL